MTTAQIKLTDEEMRALEDISRHERRSLSDLIQGSVEALLREHSPGNGAELPPEVRLCPQPLAEKIDLRDLDRPQGPHTGINAIIGRWPGDESEAEILAALDELS
jgi:hypothetical protein